MATVAEQIINCTRSGARNAMNSDGIYVPLIGILLPAIADKKDGYAEFQWSPRMGVYQALVELNNKTDGVADDLLPNRPLEFVYRDSKCDRAWALEGALALRNMGVDAIVGAGCSSASEMAALATASAFPVPVISASSTSPTLSDADRYPYFLRTVPADDFQAQVMADLLVNYFEYMTVAVVYESSTYGENLYLAFRSYAPDYGITLAQAVTFAPGADSFSSQFTAVKQSGSQVILLLCQATDGSRFMRGAYMDGGVGGVGYLNLVGDSMAGSDVWTADEMLSANVTLRELVLRG
eukprot:4952497-Prymnesium_polylepis.1